MSIVLIEYRGAGKGVAGKLFAAHLLSPLIVKFLQNWQEKIATVRVDKLKSFSGLGRLLMLIVGSPLPLAYQLNK
jgi:hypothetical protein